MLNIMVAKRYASALLDVAMGEGVLESVESDFRYLVEVIDENQQYKKLMISSVAPSRVKLLFFNTATQKREWHALIRNLIRLLILNNRMDLIHLILSQFLLMIDEKNEIKHVKITTACKLESNIREKIQGELKRFLQSDVKVQEVVDASIIGGLIVLVDSKLLDCSIATKLNKIKKIAQM